MNKSKYQKGDKVLFEDVRGQFQAGLVQEVCEDTITVRSGYTEWNVPRDAIHGKVDSLMPCRVCGGKVSRTAERCPHCGEVAPGIYVVCPKCGSRNLMIGKPPGFDMGKAAAGFLVLGPVGLLFGSSGENDIPLLCPACRHSWTQKHKTLV